MRHYSIIRSVLLSLIALGSNHFDPIASADQPNILIILADDLGFSDLGCYGSEIETPNLDSLANNGLRFTQFHNTGRCWPTRASLLTGYYAQQVLRDKLPGVEKTGANGQRPDWAPLLPKLIDAADYRSYHSGKWHIDGLPIGEGFDRSYFLSDAGRYFNPKRILIDDKPQPAVARGSDYYATTAIADHAIEVLNEHAAHHSDQPFFHFVAFTAPHFPLHALPEDIEKYRDRYLEGWDRIRAERWSRIKSLEILSGNLSEVERETGPPYKHPQDIEALGAGEVALPVRWVELSEEQKRFQATKMAIHAAMIDRMDLEIGRIVTLLRDRDQLANTLILFLSDNGCSSEIMVRDDGHDPNSAPGSADTHLCLGPGWSSVGNTPFRKHKTWVHEGGTCTPLIVHWPKGINAKGEFRHNPGHVIDIVPTILELANVEAGVTGDSPKRPGKSLIPVFTNDNSVEHDYLWWSHDNHSAIRIGDWKAVKTVLTPWELFDLSVDPTETKDLSLTEKAKLEMLKSRWSEIQTEFMENANSNLDQLSK